MSDEMTDFISISKALSDHNRLRALLSLRKGELCVCQIIELLALAPSTVSKHMSILKSAGLVESRKEERWVFYKLPSRHNGNDMTSKVLKMLFSSFEHDRQAVEDRERMEKILRTDPAIICKTNRNKEDRGNHGREN